MPVESFLGVLTTQAGVNVGAGGELHIRGGRSNEVGYYIDGVSVSNPFFTNSLSVNVSNKALSELLFLFILLKKSGMPANEMVKIFDKNLMIVWIIVI